MSQRQRSGFSSGFSGCFGVGCAVLLVVIAAFVVLGLATTLVGGSH